MNPASMWLKTPHYAMDEASHGLIFPILLIYGMRNLDCPLKLLGVQRTIIQLKNHGIDGEYASQPTQR